MGRLDVQQYGEPDAYGHRKKASVAELLADEVKQRTGEETIVSDLTYDLRSGDPDFIDKLVALTFGNMAYDAILEGKTGLMSALVNGCYDLVPIPDPKLGPRSSTSPPPTTPSATSDLRQQARAAGVSQSGVVGWGCRRQASPKMRRALPPRIAVLSASDTGRPVTWAVSEPMNGSSVPNRIWPAPTAPTANISACAPNAQLS